MNDRKKWRERIRDIRAGSKTWWWWWWYIYLKDIYAILLLVTKMQQFNSSLQSLNQWNLGYKWSSSSCRAISISIVHRFRSVFKATSCIGTELLYVGPSCLCLSMWRGPQEYVTYEFVPTSPAVPRMSGSSNLDSFRDGGGVSGRRAAALSGAASRTCSILLAAFLCSCRQAFSLSV